MGLPPTSPRLKFTHTHLGGSPVPRRPPRHPPSPSARSRSLELLDREEKKSVSPVRETETPTRPRSRSLDGLLDEDGMVPDMKTEELPKQSDESDETDVKESQEALDRLSDRKIVGDDGLVQVQSRQTDTGSIVNRNENPVPVPRQRVKAPAVEPKLETVNIVQKEEASSTCEGSPTRPTKDEQPSSVYSNLEDRKEEDSQTSSENVDPCDSNVELKEKLLMVTGNDKSTLLKTRSCGAGLDSDESISSNEFKPKSKEQGSLLSLPTGAEPKRKKNFMDKCVNKVRSFMRK